MSNYTNPYAQQIHTILSPLIGELMSKGALKTQCKKIGIDEESIRKENLLPISIGLKTGLVIFIGPDGAMKIAEDIASIS
jgi:hypothetical protein